jgi:hypothetical protein
MLIEKISPDIGWLNAGRIFTANPDRDFPNLPETPQGDSSQMTKP